MPEGVTHVQLGFNANTGAVGIRPATETLDLNGLIGFYLNSRTEAEASEPGPAEPPANVVKPEPARRKTKAA